MRACYLLAHGWGLDAESLAPLARALRETGAVARAMDLGFFGAPRDVPSIAGERWIAVGHSYGFAHLLSTRHAFAGAVSIAGFTRFAGEIAFLDDALARDAPRALRAFRRRCGLATSLPGTPDVPLLRRHLSRLGALALPYPNVPVLALAATEDLVVSSATTRACFEGRPQTTLFRRGGSHALAQDAPDWCADRIDAFARTLA